MTAAYFFVLGGVVGSFLNVVAFRMPLGLNLLWPGSRCPACGTPIRLRDNIPIFSWLWLRGRCRTCGSEIPARYFLVELTMASMFLALAGFELLSGGANLPLRGQNPRTGVVQVIWETKWDLLGIYLYHCCLLSTLMAIALIRLDRQTAPRRLWLVALGLGLVFPLAWPDLRPVPWLFPRPDWLPSDWRSGLTEGLAGALAGLIAGGLLAVASRSSTGRDDRFDAMLPTLSIIGAFLGWQAAVSVAVLAAIGMSLACIAGLLWRRRRPWPLAVWLTVATFVQLGLWRFLSEQPGWPGHIAGWIVFAVYALGLCLLGAVIGRVGRADEVTELPAEPAPDGR